MNKFKIKISIIFVLIFFYFFGVYLLNFESSFSNNFKNVFPSYFKEFLNINSCKFNSCTHNHEPGCEIKKSVDNGLISRSRYNNYISMLLEIENNFR